MIVTGRRPMRGSPTADFKDDPPKACHWRQPSRIMGGKIRGARAMTIRLRRWTSQDTPSVLRNRTACAVQLTARGLLRVPSQRTSKHFQIQPYGWPRAMNDIYRRTFLQNSGVGVGTAAFGAMLANEGHAARRDVSEPLPGLPNLPVRAKRVIFLCMAGGPSHLETFDYKPKLAEMHDKPMPESFTNGQPIAQLQGQTLKCQGPMTKFAMYGKSGQMISDFLPWHAKMADDICIINSMVTEQINHDPAHTFMNTGTAISGRPSMGSWATYGLGSETNELPASSS